MKSLSRVRLFATTWTIAYQAPPSMGFSRQEYWSGLPFPSPKSRLWGYSQIQADPNVPNAFSIGSVPVPHPGPRGPQARGWEGEEEEANPPSDHRPWPAPATPAGKTSVPGSAHSRGEGRGGSAPRREPVSGPGACAHFPRTLPGLEQVRPDLGNEASSA